MREPKHFAALRECSLEIHHLNSVLGLLHWDQETQMPHGAANVRSAQIAKMSELVHEKRASKTFKDRLSKLISIETGKPKVKGITTMQKAALREWRKDYLRATRLPTSFVSAFSELTSEATQIWASAKKENNFKVFAPFLTKIIEMSRKKAEILGFDEHPYDALLEGYEPCMTTRKVTVIFEDLRKELVHLLKDIQNAKQIDSSFLSKKVSDEKQHKLGTELLSFLPMDKAYTRLDFSAHPFSLALHPHDSRITTRILPHNFMSNLFSILHEAGHSMYEMGLPVETWGTPLSEAVSLSIHESQSRFWETIIGRGLPFWEAHYDFLKTQVPALKSVSLQKFYRAINAVKPSLIRVEADEVTYCLHVIVRFEIEKALITGTLSVSDLPEAWNAKMKEYLGVTPSNDREGCLQDCHWSLGDFGYFPTYALGNLFAAQFHTAFAKDHPDHELRIASGDLAFIREWLRSHIHQYGRAYDANALARRITKKNLTAAPYCHYLRKKYSAIYSL